MTQIRCSVDNCEFNGNNICHAEKIEVHSEDAQRKPLNSEHTLCATFRDQDFSH